MDSQKIQIFEIYDWWYEPFWYHPYFKMGIVFLGAMMGILTLYFAYKYFKLRRKIAPKSWDKALGELYGLKMSAFEDPETHKVFYGTITKILKNYLSKRYSVDLDGKTDQEVIDVLKDSALPLDLQEQLALLMRGAEGIKFAHQEGASERMRYDQLRAIDIVRNTIPVKK